MKAITLAPSRIKRAKLDGHYDLIEEVLGDKFDTRFVPGVGNINAQVVFIGEAPGQKEDEVGEPFVGPSGKMLNQGLQSIGLQREDVFITNFLKYRPPKNRDPSGDEVPVSLGLLRKEIAIINPKVVVTLGVFSTSLFFEQPHMGTLAGQAWIKRGHTVIPMYHPASVMYGGFDRDTWYEHFQVVADCLNLNGTPLRKSLRGTR